MTLQELAACPACQGALDFQKQKINCTKCQRSYPYVDGMPWLFPDPEASLGEWRGRLKHLLQHLEGEAGLYKSELKQSDLGELTQKRLRKLLQAKVEHRKSLEELLQPLELGPGGSLEMSRALKSKLPVGQSITSYYVNLHRDWAWGADENAAGLACLKNVIGERRTLGKTLVLGAGACRLAYDMHQAYEPETTVALDINPLMFIVARKLLKGRNVKLYEFPIAPRDLDSHAVLRKLEAPEAVKPGFELVLGDATTPAFKEGAFDTVVTPWLIDIIPQQFEEFAPVVNRMLKPGGRWLNFGSLAFNHRAPAANYSYEETLELVARLGFKLTTSELSSIPYMCSPASLHGRRETAVSFAAEKTLDVPLARRKAYLPDWLLDATRPMPRTREHDVFMTVHGIYLDVVSLIDGKRSMTEIAQIFGQKYGMSPAEALGSIHGFLTKHWEENQSGGQY